MLNDRSMLAAARIVLAPLLIAQGLRVRRVALRLPEAAGPRAGDARAEGAASDAPLRLLIVGDSSAAGVGAASQAQALSGRLVEALHGQGVPRIAWRLEAATGWTSRDALGHLEALAPEPVDAALVVLGVNDVTGDRSSRAWLHDLARIDDWLVRRAGARAVLYSGLPPMGRFPLLPQPLRWYLGRRAAAYDAALAAWSGDRPWRAHVPIPDVGTAGEAAQPGADPVSEGLIASDGFHPGPLAYTVWGRQVAQAVVARLGPS